MTTKVTRVIGPLIHATIREIDRTKKNRWEKHLETCEICKAANKDMNYLWNIKNKKG